VLGGGVLGFFGLGFYVYGMGIAEDDQIKIAFLVAFLGAVIGAFIGAEIPKTAIVATVAIGILLLIVLNFWKDFLDREE